MNLPNTYKPFLTIVSLFIFISLANIPVIKTLWKYSFDDGTYSHAYLIPLITLYLYFKLSEIGKLIYRESFSIAWFVLLVLASLALFITANAQVSVGYWLSFLTIATAAILFIFRFNWYVLFPVAFLVFIIPMWGVLTNILQSISVIAVTFMMSFTSIPTYVETEFITIPAGTFEIADGCSGLRYIIVSLAISSLFIFMYISNMKKAVMFFTFAILGALLTNWIRITALIMIGDYTDMQSSLMEDHNTFGWYLYIPFMFLLFWWGNKLSDRDLFSVEPSSETAHFSTPSSLIAMCLCVILSSTTAMALLKSANNIAVLNNRVGPLPTIHLYSHYEIVKNTQHLTHLKYKYENTLLDATPTFYNNDFIPSGWSIVSSDTKDNWKTYQIQNSLGEKAIILTSYQLDDYFTSSSGKFKLQRLKSGITFPQKPILNWIFSKCNRRCIEDDLIKQYTVSQTPKS